MEAFPHHWLRLPTIRRSSPSYRAS